MMKFRLFCMVSVAALSTFAQASFDLMYVLDGTSKAVHRVDPINRVSLGSFGAGFLSNPRSVALDSTNNVYVLDELTFNAARVRKFDGSTGEYLGGFALPYSIGQQSKLRISGNNIFITSGNAFNSAYVYNFTLSGGIVGGGSYQTGTEASVNSQGVATLNGEVYWAGLQAGFSRYNIYKTSISGSPWDGSFVNYSTTQPQSLSSAGFLTASAGTMVFLNNNNSGARFSASLGSPNSFSTSGFTFIAGIAAGHQDLVHIAGMSGSNFVTGKYYSATNDALPAIAMSGTGITDPRDIAVQVAPEPGSLLAMSLGALLLRRRKKETR